MPYRIRHAICNEIFEKTPFADTCRAVRQAGYDAIELAHFTLADSPTDIGPSRRRELREIMAGEGLEFVGLHWLMVAPKGLHVTTPDDGLRERSWQHIRHLIDLCADLGERKIMVFGSPFQRNSTGGSTPAEATRRFTEGLAGVSNVAASRGVTILVEALPKAQSDIVNTVAEAVAIVDQISSPAIQTMFDTHNAADETEPHAVILERYLDKIRHIHVNEMDGSYCGARDYDFRPILEVVQRREFAGFVSLEAFDFTPGGEKIARESLAHLKALEETL
ncbi:MAG: sugar phosphate isomerase/epimerase [Bryobacteraceae bacterium]|nr:sugar phosphate isomerase/epimerase [Bryobacteraceae bacterium]